jgi:hypothetical protein
LVAGHGANGFKEGEQVGAVVVDLDVGKGKASTHAPCFSWKEDNKERTPPSEGVQAVWEVIRTIQQISENSC